MAQYSGESLVQQLRAEEERSTKLAAANEVLRDAQQFLVAKVQSLADTYTQKILELEAQVEQLSSANQQKGRSVPAEVEAVLLSTSRRLDAKEVECDALRQELEGAISDNDELVKQVEVLQETVERLTSAQERSAASSARHQPQETTRTTPNSNLPQTYTPPLPGSIPVVMPIAPQVPQEGPQEVAAPTPAAPQSATGTVSGPPTYPEPMDLPDLPAPVVSSGGEVFSSVLPMMQAMKELGLAVEASGAFAAGHPLSRTGSNTNIPPNLGGIPCLSLLCTVVSGLRASDVYYETFECLEKIDRSRQPVVVAMLMEVSTTSRRIDVALEQATISARDSGGLRARERLEEQIKALREENRSMLSDLESAVEPGPDGELRLVGVVGGLAEPTVVDEWHERAADLLAAAESIRNISQQHVLEASSTSGYSSIVEGSFAEPKIASPILPTAAPPPAIVPSQAAAPPPTPQRPAAYVPPHETRQSPDVRASNEPRAVSTSPDSQRRSSPSNATSAVYAWDARSFSGLAQPSSHQAAAALPLRSSFHQTIGSPSRDVPQELVRRESPVNSNAVPDLTPATSLAAMWDLPAGVSGVVVPPDASQSEAPAQPSASTPLPPSAGMRQTKFAPPFSSSPPPAKLPLKRPPTSPGSPPRALPTGKLPLKAPPGGHALGLKKLPLLRKGPQVPPTATPNFDEVDGSPAGRPPPPPRLH